MKHTIKGPDLARPGPTIPQDPAPDRRNRRLPYRKPRLRILGDVRDMTFGASPGIGDSANPALLKP